MTKKGFFITATDTGVGKTVSVLCLAHLLRRQGLNVGVMKPIQCGGNDSAFLKKKLSLNDPLSTINPAFAEEPLSPHLAFTRSKKKVSIQKILKSYRYLQSRYDVVLVEGAGGLLVPITKNYFMADLAEEMGLELIIVARLGLGTINHTLLTIKHAQSKNLKVSGVIFSEIRKGKRGIPELTNPKAIKEFGSVPILGTIPYLNNFSGKNILHLCRNKINLKILFKEKKKNSGLYAALDKNTSGIPLHK